MTPKDFIDQIIGLAIFSVVAYAIFCLSLACIRAGTQRQQGKHLEPGLSELILRALVLKGVFGKNLQAKLQAREKLKKEAKRVSANLPFQRKNEDKKKAS